MKTALVTGGSRGIGAAIVRELSKQGWQVAFCYRSSKEMARQLAAETGALAIRCDVTDSGQVSAMVTQVQQQFRHIDMLVNNAGVAWQGLLTDMTDDDWRTVLDTSLTAAFFTCRAVIPGMVSRRIGRIINISSIWGRVGPVARPPIPPPKPGLLVSPRRWPRSWGPAASPSIACVRESSRPICWLATPPRIWPRWPTKRPCAVSVPLRMWPLLSAGWPTIPPGLSPGRSSGWMAALGSKVVR